MNERKKGTKRKHLTEMKRKEERKINVNFSSVTITCVQFLILNNEIENVNYISRKMHTDLILPFSSCFTRIQNQSNDINC